MAKQVDDNGRPIITRSPRQASRIFGLDQPSFMSSHNGSGAFPGAPRPKFLFVVRFIRGAGQGPARWKDGLSFAVKSVGRPTVTPKIQEMNQYNKKRLIQTGVKYSPVSIEFHDTVDSVVTTMWSEYASYYFGDFRRQDDMDWSYDVTMPEMFDITGRGFGMTLPGTDNSNSETGSFFEKVECYQFFGGMYTQFDLINPRINSFSPDAMDYNNMESHGIQMGLDYEGIIYHYRDKPVRIIDNPDLVELYGNQIDGDVYEPPNTYSESIFTNVGSSLGALNSIPQNLGRLIGNEKLAGTSIIPSSITKGLGVLGSFGAFDFGGGVEQILAPITSATSTISKNVGLLTLSDKGPNNGMTAADVIAGKVQTSVPNVNDGRNASSQVGIRTSPPKEPPIL